MSSTTSQSSSQSNLKTSFAAAAVVLLIIIAIGVVHHTLVGSSPSLAQEMDVNKHPIPAWVTKDAEQSQGDITKLPPAEQQKLYMSYPGQGARIIIIAAYQMQH